MARLGLCLMLLCGCGLVGKDFEIEQPFATSGAAGDSASIDASRLTGPLPALSKVASLTLKAARIDATDGKDVSFVSGAHLSARPPLGPIVLLASLISPAAAPATSVQLQTDQTRDLKPFLEQNSNLDASIDYAPAPATTRTLKLVLTLRASLF